MSFKTDRPLFPYREPSYGDQAAKLNQKQRLLRIYVLAETSYHGDINAKGWSGQVAWAGLMKPEDRSKVLEQLKLPAETGPDQFYLTEYEDNWPYTVAAGDVYFSADAEPNSVKRPPIIEYTKNTVPGDATIYVLAGILLVLPLMLRGWRRPRTNLT